MRKTERLGVWIADNPMVIIAAAAVITILAFHYAQEIEMQGMATESFVGKDSPLYQIYDHLFVERFGFESIVVVIEGDDVARRDVLEAELRLSDGMMGAPGVLATNGIADIVAEAAEARDGKRAIPDQESIDAILASIDPIMIESIMPDRRHTMFAVEMPMYLSDDEMREIMIETEGQMMLAKFPPDVGLVVTGSPALSNSIMEEMTKSNGPLLMLAGVLMVFALLLVFRHVRWPLLPIPIVFLGIIWTFGAMGFLHIPMTMVSMSAFPVLIGIGIDYAIQFHNRIDEEFGKAGSPVKAVISTVNNTAIPVMIALSITAAGFVSLLTSSVPMTRDFGLICLIGLFMCYLSALFVGITVLAAVEARNGRKRGEVDGASKESFVGSYLEGMAEFCINRWKVVLSLAFILALAGNYADSQVAINTDFKTYIPQDMPPLVHFWHMSEIFGGSDEINLIVQADDVTDPQTVKWMDRFGSYLLGSRDQVYAVSSIATLMKQATGGEIPTTRTEIRDSFEGIPPQLVSKNVDGHDTAIISLNIGEAVRDLGEEGIDRLLKEVEKDIAWFPPPPGVSVRESGDLVVMTTVIGALTTGRTEMTLLGLVLIFAILLIIYRDMIKALLPVLPMLVVIGWMGGVMYLGNIQYTPLTATLGALILGVGSEYSILMMERFYEELAKVGEPREALKTAVNRIGSALIASGMTTVFGFAALISSPFLITSNFGTVTVLAVIFALLTTFTVFAVLMLRLEIRRKAFKDLKHRVFNSQRRTTH
ncbi:MAG: RND family transporter [Methanotrichaceae archaeon]|nr:RND family transporter [Methanotrichaceae archaeon]